ncbi:MAG TPA: tRNA (N(6)-L-threonylcarbamoyladenosine(37)-C(2))-methylthiotransferase MtaB [bacterium]|nr:tRNA (N(6)-L-threonylcarbamoyladenosine(37)-C(2))-methylthiotransferase MtaB [bacterium]
MKRFAITTLGCKLNQADSEVVREAFERAGYAMVPFSEEADVYVVNTCTVTGATDHQSRQLLRRALREKERRPGVRVVAAGCYPQADAEGLIRMAPGLDLVVGALDREMIPTLLESAEPGSTRSFVRDISAEREFMPTPVERFAGRTRAFLRIQEGCNRRCTYCIVPTARGRERSAPPEAVLSQARAFIDAGVKEIVVTGVHIGRYGAGLAETGSFASLLTSLASIENLRRIRLSSLDPAEFTDELYDALAGAGRALCPHFHISIQSGDDSIIRAMGRSGAADDVRNTVSRLRSIYPDAAVGADIIVGFPGETDENFENTFRLAEELRLSHMHVFRYSPRPGTPAAGFDNQTPEHVKKERSAALLNLRARLGREFREHFIGRKMEVLFETRRCRDTGLLTGLTRNYIRVTAHGPDSLMGEITDITPTESTATGLTSPE